MFAAASSGFPVELAGVGELYAAFLNESRTRGCLVAPRAGNPDTWAENDGRSPSIAFYLRSNKSRIETEYFLNQLSF
jgi:hypothetical protein